MLRKYPQAVIELWFNNFELAYFDDERALITTTSDGYVDLLNKKYAPEISEIFEQTLNFHLTVKIFAKSKFNMEEALLSEINAPSATPLPVQETPVPEQTVPEKENFEPSHDTGFISEKDYTFDNFIVIKS